MFFWVSGRVQRFSRLRISFSAIADRVLLNDSVSRSLRMPARGSGRERAAGGLAESRGESARR